MKTARAGCVRALSFVMFMVLGGLAGQVCAVCAQTDAAGTWYTYGVTGNSAQGGFDSYSRCKIVLGTTGSVVASMSSCVGRDDVGRFYLTVTGGSVTVATTCAITGSIVIGGQRYTIEYGQIATDKNMISFAIYMNANPDNLGMLTGVKR